MRPQGSPLNKGEPWVVRIRIGLLRFTAACCPTSQALCASSPSQGEPGASEGAGLEIHEVVDHVEDVDGLELLFGAELGQAGGA